LAFISPSTDEPTETPVPSKGAGVFVFGYRDIIRSRYLNGPERAEWISAEMAKARSGSRNEIRVAVLEASLFGEVRPLVPPDHLEAIVKASSVLGFFAGAIACGLSKGAHQRQILT
jgi:hypothetical protein